ncbi:MAG: efflux RND transporter periplasmic adaptor subunit [Sulfuricurvum sp.]|jgi:multidrug resistance efflux pump|uniref:efflux RND transporter periplasmic adaptor subunit n=1 Tax=Sulfuricurvum sp. TaxID=2025608 RepID=UPI0025D66B79|nr:efflux RND transporter periplasmic adaptor subunit [Sulfuricurvum sp.]MCK9372227.1 efflux RND transporter periplasmic adaptor subunit [Sulfuricurvum sp.]
MISAKTKYTIAFIAVALIAGAVIVKKVILPKAAPVVAETNTTVRAANTIHGVGTLEAKEIVILAPKTTAKLQALYADEGDAVQANQVLATMEISELRGNLQESAASIAKSRSQFAASKAVIEDLEAKKSLSDTTLSRYGTLLSGGFVTQAEFDAAQAAQRSASAQLTAAKANLQLSGYDIAKAEAALAAQMAKIDDLTLRSPFEGFVVSRNAEAGSTVGSGSAVFRIANPKSLWVKVYIDERQSGALKIGQSATVTLRSFPEKRFTGEVARIGVESDRITEERVVYIRLRDLTDFLHIGEQAEAEISLISKSDSPL